jgi:hypothetical protein
MTKNNGSPIFRESQLVTAFADGESKKHGEPPGNFSAQVNHSTGHFRTSNGAGNSAPRQPHLPLDR